MDSRAHLKNCRHISDAIADAIAPLIGEYEDRTFERGITGDVTYEIDVPIEDAVAGFFADNEIPATVSTEDTGTRDFNGGGPIYLIDPLDGSRNARRGLPFYCCSIAVFPPGSTELSQAEVSLIRRLDHDETFHAISGEGAMHDGAPMHPSKKTGITDAIICLGSHFASSYEAHRDLVAKLAKMGDGGPQDAMLKCLGSTALELAHIACGRADMLVDLRYGHGLSVCPKTYDIAAGIHICRQAGAKAIYGSENLPQELPPDPSIPIQVAAAANEPLFTLLSNTIR